MTGSCPLPVDWLDYLDGDGTPELATHLADCPSCRVLVASLEATPIATVSTDWTAPFIGNLDAVWHEDRPPNPAPAEFWFSAPSFELDYSVFATPGSGKSSSFAYQDVDRMLLLVVSHPDQDHELEWLDVVPVLSDIERATETDLLFGPDENSLGAPWRVLFAYQCKVARQQLDTRVGSLRELGETTLFSALTGEVDDARWGVPLQHPDDPRARWDDDFDEAMLRLRTPWLLVSGATSVDDQDDESSRRLYLVEAKEPSLPAEIPDELAAHQVYWLSPVREPPTALALAAASSPAPSKSVWALEADAFKLAGELDVDWQKGLLVFFVSAVTVTHASRLRLHLVASGKAYTSEPFVPTENAEVQVAQGLTKEAVDKLGAEVVP